MTRYGQLVPFGISAAFSLQQAGNGDDCASSSCVPMMTPFPFSSLARLILLPGEFSMSSTSGILSPTLTKAREVEWK